LVWSGWTRGLHWAVAVCVVSLVATGWLATQLPAAAATAAAEAHRNAGYVLLAALAARLYLLVFGSGTEHWRDFVPLSAQQRRSALAVARFYLTRTRTELPPYFGHNPLWGPIYLVLYALLALQGLTGLLGPHPWHAAGLPVIVGLAAAHLVGVFLHDWKATSGEVSAMISGYKTFSPRPLDPWPGQGVHSVPVEALSRRPPAGSGRVPPAG
jgi:Ni/Fe-hydrogenase 1 B-type cytochrome subunit